MYCYTEFKLRYLNLKLFSVGIKELIEPIVLWGEKADGFLLFLKALSPETDLLVTLGDFTVKICKIWKGNMYLTENRFSRNKIKYGVRWLITIISITYVQKEF